jgi:hypothetical protein
VACVTSIVLWVQSWIRLAGRFGHSALRCTDGSVGATPTGRRRYERVKQRGGPKRDGEAPEIDI